MIYYDWEVIEVRKGISPVGEGRNRALREKDYKTDWHCDSLSLAPDWLTAMCVLLLQGNKYFIIIIWTQSCLLLSDDVC